MPEVSNQSQQQQQQQQQPPPSPPNMKPSTNTVETPQNFGTSNGQLDKIDRIECDSKAIPEKAKEMVDLSNNNSGEESQRIVGDSADKGGYSCISGLRVGS